METAVHGGTVNLVAGTGWLWARPGMRDAVDVLVVDEAGQLSLANVLAVSGATENLVLLGDPQQLAQPSQATTRYRPQRPVKSRLPRGSRAYAATTTASVTAGASATATEPDAAASDA